MRSAIAASMMRVGPLFGFHALVRHFQSNTLRLLQLVKEAMLRELFIGLPTLLPVVGIPLALKLVPPNQFYGFRTSTTFASPEAWYQINFATGLAMIAAGLVSGLLLLLLSYGVITLQPETRYLLGLLLTTLVMLLFLIPVVIYSNRF